MDSLQNVASTVTAVGSTLKHHSPIVWCILLPWYRSLEGHLLTASLFCTMTVAVPSEGYNLHIFWLFSMNINLSRKSHGISDKCKIAVEGHFVDVCALCCH